MLRLLVFLFAMVGTSSSCDGTVPVDGSLGSYGADSSQVSVSGLSSGGFMAVQMHVAYSETIMGVGVVAGGPYYCAEANLMKALGQCMTSPRNIDVQALQDTTNDWVTNGNIDATSNMYNDMVYLYSGTNDGTVVPGVMEALDEYYAPYINPANIMREFSLSSGHAFITDNYGNLCNTASKKPWISNCGYNQAYEILNHVYGGNLLKPDSSTAAGGDFYEFDQTEFVNSFMGGMTDTGYVYVPTGCRSSTSNCRVHVSLHGCKQGQGFLDTEYALHTGYNEVAELNDIIVIYPQAAAGASNMNGCWDWWGYTDSSYAHNQGHQMKGIKEMIDRVLYSCDDTVPVPTVPVPTVPVSTVHVPTAPVSTVHVPTAPVSTVHVPTVPVPVDGSLGSYGADSSQVSASGQGSGGYMAVQVHVAYSKTIMGVGVVAGGPYFCAQASLSKALGECMTSPFLINVGYLQQVTRNTQLTYTIDNVSNMENDMVYLYSGTNDRTVVPGVMDALDEYYTDFVNAANVKKEFSMSSGHAFITDNYGNDCNTASKKPWISNCGYNQAYEILNHIYGGNLVQPDSSTTAAGAFYEFDQSEFTPFSGGVMDNSGYVYVPTGCSSSNSNCKVHVSLHGCSQGKSFLEDEYAKNTGYNEVAELNDIIVISPQATTSMSNVNGCWDWWGYTGSNYACDLADQMKAIKKMIDRVLS